jgi:hypothetical protein
MRSAHCYPNFSNGQSRIKAQCTTNKERHIKRWEHEAVLDAMYVRLDQKPEMMGVRRQIIWYRPNDASNDGLRTIVCAY